MTISDDFTPTRRNFLIWWILANTFGISLGWVFGEFLGRELERTYGWEIGHLAGILMFEIILWTTRGSVLSRVKRYRILQPLDILIWVLTEGMGWLINSNPSSNSNILKITGGASLAAGWGAMMWLIIWFIRIPKPGKKNWAISAVLWTFLGFVAASLFFSLTMATSLQIGYMLSNMGSPLIGMAIAGAILGVLLGLVTGIAMIRLLKWPSTENKKLLIN